MKLALLILGFLFVFSTAALILTWAVFEDAKTAPSWENRKHLKNFARKSLILGITLGFIDLLGIILVIKFIF